MSTNLALVRTWLESEGIGFTDVEDAPAIAFPFAGTNGRWTSVFVVRDESEQICCYARCPFEAPEERRDDVARLLTRANFGLMVGAWEMDYSDGEIRFRAGMDFEDIGLSAQNVRNIFYYVAYVFNEWMPAVTAVTLDNADPFEAADEIEEE